MRILLETPRLRLCAFTPADKDLIVELDSDPEVMRWLNGGNPTPPEYVEREILPRFTSYDGAFGFWAAHRKDTEEFIGWFSLRPNGDGEAALGYRLRRAAWGQGYATEAGAALIRLAFDELGMQRVMAGTYEKNIRSQRVMERLGMRERGRFKITEEDLASSDTFDPGSQPAWDGYDLEFEIVAPPPDAVRYTAAGGVVVDGDRVLVLYRPSREQVRLPKGHVEPDEEIAAAAVREVREESGYIADARADLGSQEVGFDHDGRHWVRTERYFLMTLADPTRYGHEEQFEPRWVEWDDAARSLTFPSEREWPRRASAVARQRGSETGS